MADEKLLQFLRERIAFVRRELQGQGWSEQQIAESFTQVATEVAGTAPVIAAPRARLTASKLLLGIGGLIIVLAGIFYITLNWSAWSPFMRVLAILLPNLIVSFAGAQLWNRDGWRHSATVLLVVGALMVPLTFVVANAQLEILTMFDLDTQGFVISLAVFSVYAGLQIAFPVPAWSVLTSASALIAYAFLLSLGDLYTERGVGWLGFIPAGGLFAYGVWRERRGQREDARGPYLFGVLTLVLSLIILTAEGNLLRAFLDGPDYGREADLLQGWSSVIIGALSWLISAGMVRLRLAGPVRLSTIFRIGAILAVLGGIWMMGLRGSYPFYEILLLAGSFGAIFLSVPARSESLLFGGTLFLVVFIFGIGGEYFQNEVGWPLTLFVAGLLSMGAGLLMERFRRRLKEPSV